MRIRIPYRLKRELSWVTPVWIKRPAKGFIHKIRKGYVKSYYLPKDLTLKEFFNILNSRKVNYVVYKWKTTTDGDFDILVRDSDIAYVTNLLVQLPRRESRGLTHIDLHTIYGTGGGKLYFPPDISQKIMLNKVVGSFNSYIPNSETQFNILAYHCVYNLGTGSGIPISNSTDTSIDTVHTKEKHNYFELLHYLTLSQTFTPFALTLENLMNYLKNAQWSPSIDFLIFKGRNNHFIKSLVESELSKFPHPPGLSLFFFRYDSHFERSKREIEDIFFRYDCEILKYVKVDERLSLKVLQEIRGGNWYQEVENLNGGKLTHILIVKDHSPKSSRKDLKFIKYPRDNAKTETVKSEIRNFLKIATGDSKHFVHASDSSAQARLYMNILGLESD